MRLREDLGMLLQWLVCFSSMSLFLGVYGGRSNTFETDALLHFIQAIDPKNKLQVDRDGYIPDCCSGRWAGINCDLLMHSVTEIRLENLNLSGTIDADSLCKLPSLQVLSLARNHVVGGIPDSISNCVSLWHLNLSSNLLYGTVPSSLNSLKSLRSLDISSNNLTGRIPHFRQELKQVYPITMVPNTTQGKFADMPPRAPNNQDQKRSGKYVPIFLLIAFFSLFIFLTKKKFPKRTDLEMENKEHHPEPPVKLVVVDTDREKPPEEPSALVFFGEERERFRIDDLLGSAADLQGQSVYSSLYKVKLNSNTIFAVKRLRKLQVSVEDFRSTMTWIGKLEHPNLLPLVACHVTEHEKLLVYRYQSSGSLSHLLSKYAEGGRDFPWDLRLSIASGIARGLHYILKESCNRNIPHGNLKPSNILLNENEEPLISEYGIRSFLDPKWALLYSYNGYKAPEKKLTEKADVFSFGIILLELLTGRTVENSSLDLPKWVKAMVREEWTAEVFDREVNRVGRHWAFPLLNVALQCVSHAPEQRPNISEVLEKIENVVNAQEDYSFSSTSSVESSQQDCSLIHTVIPEAWETPGSKG